MTPGESRDDPPACHGLVRGRLVIDPVGRDKKPLIAWKPFQQQRAPLEQVERWIHQLAPSVWAGATGQVSGRISLDFDLPDGPRTLERLGLDPHRATPSGGFHVDVQDPGWRVPTVSGKTKKSLGVRYPGLDARGGAGYINLYGETTSGSYRYLTDDRAPVLLEALPEDLRSALGLLAPPSETAAPVTPTPLQGTTMHAVQTGEDGTDEALQGALEAELLWALDRVPGEGRNNAGFQLACRLRDHRFSRASAELAMTVFPELVPPVNSKGMPEEYTLAEAMASLEQAWSRPPRGTDGARGCRR